MRVLIYLGSAGLAAVAVLATVLSWPAAVPVACGMGLLVGLVWLQLDTRRHLGSLRRQVRRDVTRLKDSSDRATRLARQNAESLDAVAQQSRSLAEGVGELRDDIRDSHEHQARTMAEQSAAIEQILVLGSATTSALSDSAASAKDFHRQHAVAETTATDRHGELHALLRLAIKQVKSTRPETVAQVQALLELNRALTPHQPMPANQGGWAADPTTVVALVRHVLDHRPHLVVECGSGLSTIWIGHALKQNGHGRLISLEHDHDWAELSRSRVRAHELEDIVEVRDAPLGDTTIEERTQSWYAHESFSDLESIEVLFVDGPPAATGDAARFPAFPLLSERLADHAMVVLDDTVRQEERQIVRRWTTDPDLVVVDDLAGRSTVMRYQRSRTADPG